MTEQNVFQLFSPPLIQALKERGFEMGLISNSKSDWLIHSILERRDLEKFFQVIVTSAAVRVRKPRSEIFLQALNALKVRGSESVFVGDSIQADVSGANSLGMRSIHVFRKPITTTHPAKPDATVTSLSEIPRLITSWNNGTNTSTN